MQAGRFRPLELLGRGGMGQVWKAIDQTTGNAVALKLLHSFGSDDTGELTSRFMRETRVLSSVKDVHVVQVIDFGTLESGEWFIAMELLEGESLHAQLKQAGSFPAAMALSLFKQLAAGLDSVHRQGVIHRDIKPANLILSKRDHTLKIIDFGIARSLEEDQTQLTSTGAMVGTVEYAAPEQLQGKVSLATDQYAAAMVLYRMLAGRLPFEGPGMAALMFQQLHAEPPRLRSLGVDVSASFDEVLGRALKKEPGLRYPTVKLLADELEQALHRAAVVVEAPTAPKPLLTPSQGVPRQDNATDWGSGLVSSLLATLDLAALHAPTDPCIRFSRARLRAAIDAVFQHEGRFELTLDQALLLLNGRRLIVAHESMLRVQSVYRRLEEIGVLSLKLPNGLTENELDGLLLLFGGHLPAAQALQPLSRLKVTLGGEARTRHAPRASFGWQRAVAQVGRWLEAVTHEEAADAACLSGLALDIIDHTRERTAGFAGQSVAANRVTLASTRVNTAWLADSVADAMKLPGWARQNLAFVALTCQPLVRAASPLDDAFDVWATISAGMREGARSPLAWLRIVNAANRAAVADSPEKFRLAPELERLVTWCAWADTTWARMPEASGQAVATALEREAAAFKDDVWPAVATALQTLDVASVTAGRATFLARRRQRGPGPMPALPGLVATLGQPNLSRLVQVVGAAARRKPPLLRLLLELVDGLLFQQRVGAVAELFESLLTAARTSDELQRELAVPRASLGESERLRLLAAVLEDQPGVAKDAARVLAMLDPGAAPALVEVLLEVPDGPARRVLTQALIALGAPAKAAIVRGAEKGPLARAVLAPVLHRLGAPVVAELAGALKSADARTAIELGRALASVGTGEAARALAEGLRHGEPRVRVACAQLLGDVEWSDAAAELIKLVLSPAYETFSAPEQHTVLVALLRKWGPAVEAHVTQVLTAKSGLLQRKRASDDKERLLAALAAAATVGIVRFMTAFAQADARDPAVKAAVEKALAQARARLAGGTPSAS